MAAVHPGLVALALPDVGLDAMGHFLGVGRGCGGPRSADHFQEGLGSPLLVPQEPVGPDVPALLAGKQRLLQGSVRRRKFLPAVGARPFMDDRSLPLLVGLGPRHERHGGLRALAVGTSLECYVVLNHDLFPSCGWWRSPGTRRRIDHSIVDNLSRP